MEVEDHVLAFHFLEDGVEVLVRHDAVVGVGCDAVGVGLDACDAGAFRFDYGFWGDVGVEVEGHEEGDVGFEGLQGFFVGETVFDRYYGRDEVGHYEDCVDAATADGWAGVR